MSALSRWCDALRSPDEKLHWFFADQFAKKSDAKMMISMFSLILNHPCAAALSAAAAAPPWLLTPPAATPAPAGGRSA